MGRRYDLRRLNRQEDGQVLPVLITDVSAAIATLDANHPLAGQDLTFDNQLVAIV